MIFEARDARAWVRWWWFARVGYGEEGGRGEGGACGDRKGYSEVVIGVGYDCGEQVNEFRVGVNSGRGVKV